jgi:hypothetical protein
LARRVQKPHLTQVGWRCGREQQPWPVAAQNSRRGRARSSAVESRLRHRCVVNGLANQDSGCATHLRQTNGHRPSQAEAWQPRRPPMHSASCRGGSE